MILDFMTSFIVEIFIMLVDRNIWTENNLI